MKKLIIPGILAVAFSANAVVKEVTKHHEIDEALSSGKKTVINIHAPRCKPCEKMKGDLRDFSDERPEVNVISIHAANHKHLEEKLLREHHVERMGYPITITFDEAGRKTNVLHGAQSKAELHDAISDRNVKTRIESSARSVGHEVKHVAKKVGKGIKNAAHRVSDAVSGSCPVVHNEMVYPEQGRRVRKEVVTKETSTTRSPRGNRVKKVTREEVSVN